MNNFLNVLYEDNHLIAVNKPNGFLSQGDITGDPSMADVVKRYIKDRYNKPGKVFLGLVHRIDRPVSGVLVFARTSKALERVNKLFREQKVDKTYFALVKERPSEVEDTLVHYIKKDTTKNVSKAFIRQSNRSKGAKRAELSFELMATIGENSLLKVHPKTGRPHQIRVQLSKIGSPIRGDVKYGFPKPKFDGSIYLHCRSMTFEHPVKKEPITIVAPTPDDQIWNNFSHIWEDEI